MRRAISRAPQIGVINNKVFSLLFGEGDAILQRVVIDLLSFVE